jgi:hypothetical protein
LCADPIQSWAIGASAELDPSLLELLEDGFSQRQEDEDRFDAAVGLCGMLDAISGKASTEAPDDAHVRVVEGWMLGVR